MPPEKAGALPRADIVAFGLSSGETVQVEVQLEIFPELHGDRWQLDLPRRNADTPNLSRERRVVVKAEADPEFWVDDVNNLRAKFMTSRSNDTVTLAWPAQVRGGSGLLAELETTPSAQSGQGSFRLALRLGESKAAAPDHVVFVVDRSRSTERHLQRSAGRVFAGLLDTLDRKSTFELIRFDRDASLELHEGPDGRPLRASDESARAALIKTLDSAERNQGSNVGAALVLVGERLAERRARRPLVVFVTDGVIPSTQDANALATHFDDARGTSARPEFLFLIDDPLLNRTGLSAESGIANLAGALGARVRRETLANIGRDEVGALASSPRVLRDLEVHLPAGAELETPVPSGLIAGQIVVLEGRYRGRAPVGLSVSGRTGSKRLRVQPKARQRPTKVQAFVSPGVGRDEALAVAQGFALPAWHTRDLSRLTSLSVLHASGDGRAREGYIDQEIVKRYMHTRVFPRASACYNRALMSNQVLEGRVVFEFELGKGEVMSASVTNPELNYEIGSFIECLEDAAWALEIPAGRLDSETYRVRYPLRFTPPEGGQAPVTKDGPDPLFEMLIYKADTLAK